MNFWRKLTNSIQKPSFIKEVYKESTAKAFTYLVLMFTLVFLIVAIPASIKGFTAVSAIQEEFAREVPDFKLEKGEFYFAGKQPYIHERDGQVIVIDTTGKTTEKALEDYDNGILITKTQFIQKQMMKTTVYRFSDMKELTLNKKTVQSWIPYLKLFIPVIAVFAYIFLLARKIIGILIISSIGLLFAKRKELITYSRAVNITIYASTLPTFIQGIRELAFPNLGYFWIIYLIIILIYIAIGIRAIEAEE